MVKRISLSIIIIVLVLFFMLSTFYFTEKFYPLLYRNEISTACKKYNLPQELVYSIIYCESGFNENAVSNQGAVGLMQLMPQTAYFIEENSSINLYDPITNIELGCKYLSYLSNRFSTQNEMICAYNAGEGNVKKWLNSPNTHDFTNNPELIPFNETRQYLQKVNKTIIIYKNKLKNYQ